MKRMGCVLVLVVLSSGLAGAQKPRTLRDWAREKGYVWTTYHADTWFGPESLNELVAKKDAIILGRVMGERTRLSPDEQRVVTDYDVEVLDVVKTNDESVSAGATVIVSKVGGNLLLEGKPVRMDTPGSPPIPWIQPHLFLLSKSATEGGYTGSGDFSLFAVKDDRLVCNPTQVGHPALRGLCGKTTAQATQLLKETIAGSKK